MSSSSEIYFSVKNYLKSFKIPSKSCALTGHLISSGMPMFFWFEGMVYSPKVHCRLSSKSIWDWQWVRQTRNLVAHISEHCPDLVVQPRQQWPLDVLWQSFRKLFRLISKTPVSCRRSEEADEEAMVEAARATRAKLISLMVDLCVCCGGGLGDKGQRPFFLDLGDKGRKQSVVYFTQYSFMRRSH